MNSEVFLYTACLVILSILIGYLLLEYIMNN